MKLRTVFLLTLGALGLTALGATAQPVVFDPLEPSSGFPGDAVTLSWEGFEEDADYTVTVDGISAQVSGVDEDGLVFQIPAGASSGPVVIRIDDELDLPHGDALTVLRSIAVSTPAGVNLSGYVVGTPFGEAPWSAAGNTVNIAAGKPTLVAASRGEDDTTYFAYATDSTNALALSHATTALASVFMSSIAFSPDSVEADARLAFLASNPNVADIESLFIDSAASGADPFEAPEFEANASAALQALLASDLIRAKRAAPAHALDWDMQRGSHAKDYVDFIFLFAGGYPKDLKIPGLEGLDRIKSEMDSAVNNARGIPELGIRYSAQEAEVIGGLKLAANPLDWIANVYELDPLQPAFPDFKASVDALGTGDQNTVFQRLRVQELNRVSIPASPITGNLNVVAKLRDLILNKTLGPVSTPPTTRIPADKSGVYVVRAYSGAYFPMQNDLLNELPQGRAEHVLMVRVNIALAALETIDALADIFDVFDSRDLAGMLFCVEGGVAAAVIREYAQGTLDGNFYQILFKETAVGFIKSITGEAVKRGINFALGPLKALTKIATITSKVGGVAERILGLTNVVNAIAPPGIEAYAASSVETTVAVIGDPWVPEITSFYPQSGHRGTVVHINGRRFSTVAEENQVQFNTQPSTNPDGPAITAPAEILDATATELTVKVPEAAGDGNGLIQVKVDKRGSFQTGKLDAPFKNFDVLPDPVLTEVVPNPPPLTSIIQLKGMHFAPRPEDNEIKFGTEFSEQIVRPLHMNAARTELTVRSPFAFDTVTVTVTVSGRESNTLSFTPDLGEGDFGSTITVTSLVDEDNPGNPSITLREAILFAAGMRAPTSPPSPRPNGVEYETDNISGCPGEAPPNGGCGLGPGFRNSIRLDTILGGGTISLASPLPPIASGDIIDFTTFGETSGAIIDGGGMEADCFDIAGKENIVISTVAVLNFGGSGIHLRDGSKNNRFFDVFMNNCQHGVFLDGDAQGNKFEIITADQSTSHGVYLSGENVRFNQFAFDRISEERSDRSTRNAGYGVLVDNGASFNIIDCGAVQQNAMGGYRVSGANSLGNHLGLPDHLNLETQGQVFDNMGPGVHVSSSDTTIRRLNIGGNQGDGILVEGPNVSNVAISICKVGYGFNEPRPNTGTGIHVRGGVSKLRIGTTQNIGREDHATYVSGNQQHGIWLEGSTTEGQNVSDVEIVTTLLGIPHYKNNPFAFAPEPMPNGINGIYISGGAEDIDLGEKDPYSGVSSASHSTGAGLLIEGPATKDIRIANSSWGQPPGPGVIAIGPGGYGNKYGIHVRGGARNITVGTLGQPPANFEPRYDISNNSDPFFPAYLILFETSFLGNHEASVFLEDTGGEIPNDGTAVRGTPPATPVGGVVIQNCSFGLTPSFDRSTGMLHQQGGPSGAGVLIRGDNTWGNRIGGSEAGEGNRFHSNWDAAIKIEDSNVMPSRANRIIGNSIQGAFGLDRDGANDDPLGAEPGGIGVYVLNASGHVFGGTGPGEGNTIVDCNTGVLLKDATNIQVVGNDIGLGVSFADPPTSVGNKVAGVVLSGASASIIGPQNQIGNTDSENSFVDLPSIGGIYVDGGGSNQILGNWIGTDAAETGLFGNTGGGVTLSNTTANIVGGAALSDANIIVNNVDDGVRITGGGASGNHVGGNYIGTVSLPGGAAAPNTASGVRIDGGAASNEIGGSLPVVVRSTRFDRQTPNYIWDNGADGVRVDGAGALGNTITNNSITGNASGAGIATVNGGNAELPPPVITAITGDRVFGTVDDSVVPDGSLVQVFSDAGPQGNAIEGEGTVFNGQFNILTGGRVYGNVTATVTHVGTGDTSRFGMAEELEVSFDVRRAAEPPATGFVEAGGRSSAVAIALTTSAAPIEVEAITFKTTGNADEAADLAGLYLYRDADDDQVFSELDERIAGPVTIDANDDDAVFGEIGAVIDAESLETWLLVVEAAAEAAAGAEFVFEIEDNSNIVSRGAFPSAEIIESGGFPLLSDTVAVADLTTTPVLGVSPASVAADGAAGTSDVAIANLGAGTLDWAAVVTEGDFLSIGGAASGQGDGTLTLAYTENAARTERMGTVQITAAGALGSPFTLTVTQAPGFAPELIVAPDMRTVDAAAGEASYAVSNGGTGSIAWTASVQSGDFLAIASGASGIGAGDFTVAFTENTTGQDRSATIRVAETGEDVDPVTVTLLQLGCFTPDAPTNVQASDGSLAELVRINWDAVAGATEYLVYRGETNDPDAASLLGTSATTTFDDATAAAPTQSEAMGCTPAQLQFVEYFYWVTARSDCGESGRTANDTGYAGAGEPDTTTKVFERALPLSATQQARPVAVDSPLYIRLVAEDLDMASVWLEVAGAADDSYATHFLPDATGGWAVALPMQPWPAGVLLSVAANATDASGAGHSATAQFSVLHGEQAAKLDAAPLADALPGFSGAVGAPQRVGGGRAFGEAHEAWVPLPEGYGAERVALYYFLEDGAASGWYAAENVAGFLTEGGIRIETQDGQRFAVLQVGHPGIVRWGMAKTEAVESAGSFMAWPPADLALLLLVFGVFAGVRRRGKGTMAR